MRAGGRSEFDSKSPEGIGTGQRRMTQEAIMGDDIVTDSTKKIAITGEVILIPGRAIIK
jgi:hypothetical protein